MEVRSASDWVTTPRPYWTCLNQNQAIAASIGTTRELIMVLHDEVQSLTQPSEWYPSVKRTPLGWAGEVHVQ